MYFCGISCFGGSAILDGLFRDFGLFGMVFSGDFGQFVWIVQGFLGILDGYFFGSFGHF